MERLHALQVIATIPSVHEPPSQQGTGASVSRFSHHGWPDGYLISNGAVEAVVVPAIGRVMQLRLAGDAAGTLWENRALDGQLHTPVCSEWLNLGGDKCWPAPQSAWMQQQGRNWPPPAAFDSLAVEVRAGERGLVLTSPADKGYGIQVVRHVALEEEQPTMSIRTEYRKISGEPVTVGVWSITQMRDPVRVCILLPEEQRFAGGFVQLMEAEPAGLRIEDRMLSLVRHPQECVKIGTEASRLVWVGESCMVRIDAQTGPGEYPDGGCVTEVYTNPDPLEYVELETLGPLTTIGIGESIERITAYTVMPRLLADPEADARRALKLDL